MQISSEIVVGVDCVSFENATAFVYLEDVSRLDSGALLIGTAMIATVRHRAGTESRLPFAVQGVDVPRERDIAVRVHISLDGQEDVVLDDLVSTAHIPATADRQIEAPVRTV